MIIYWNQRLFNQGRHYGLGFIHKFTSAGSEFVSSSFVPRLTLLGVG